MSSSNIMLSCSGYPWSEVQTRDYSQSLSSRVCIEKKNIVHKSRGTGANQTPYSRRESTTIIRERKRSKANAEKVEKRSIQFKSRSGSKGPKGKIHGSSGVVSSKVQTGKESNHDGMKTTLNLLVFQIGSVRHPRPERKSKTVLGNPCGECNIKHSIRCIINIRIGNCQD